MSFVIEFFSCFYQISTAIQDVFVVHFLDGILTKLCSHIDRFQYRGNSIAGFLSLTNTLISSCLR
jgi:hypothetical protein